MQQGESLNSESLSDTLKPVVFMGAKPLKPAVSAEIIQLNPGHPAEPTRTRQNSRPASKAASLPSDHFKYRGRTWRIFKRNADADSNWNLYFEANKTRHLFSLGTSSKQHAITEAKLKLDLHFEKREADLRRSMQRPTAGRFATIGEIIAAVPLLPIDAGEASRSTYVSGLLYVLARALDESDEEKLKKLSSSILSDDTARRYFEKVTLHAATLEPVRAEMHKRTADTYFHNCRTLFAARSLRAMRETFKLHLPNLEPWRAGNMHAPHTTNASEFTPPAESIVRRTLIEWVRVARTPGYRVAGCDGAHGNPLSEIDRRNMFIAVGLALCFGFRRGDTTRARWNWFDRDESGPLCRAGGVTQKNKRNVLEVSAVDPFWKILNRWLVKNNWQGQPGDYCLAERPKQTGLGDRLKYAEGGKCDRELWPFYLVGKWLRSLGWTTQKTNHALRDLVASKITMKYGLDAARDWCRHGQQSTTEKHYNRFRRRGEQLNSNKLAWLRWAK
jgi:hypothetical protein